MANLLEETIEAIKAIGKTTEDVMFIGSADGEYRLSFDEFKEIANVKYDDDYGAQKVAWDLMIYFKDYSYMLRGEDDGSEWWDYQPIKIFSPHDSFKKYNRVIVKPEEIGWCSLRSMNRVEEDE